MSEISDGVTGRCYCGAVEFSIEANTVPVFAGYCHCSDCRQAHAAPIYQFVYVEKAYFHISKGAENLKFYTRTASRRDDMKRYFCVQCGSKTHNFMRAKKGEVEFELCGTFPSLFDDQTVAKNEIWSPKKHVHCGESLMDLSLIQDGLPRF